MRRFGIIYVALALLVLAGILDAQAGGTGVGWKGGKPTDTSVLAATSGTATGLTNITSTAGTITSFTSTTLNATTATFTNSTATAGTATTFTATTLYTPRYISIQAVPYDTTVTTGDGKAMVVIPYDLAGYYVTDGGPRVAYTGTCASATLDVMVTKVDITGAEALVYSMTVTNGFAGETNSGGEGSNLLAQGDYLRVDIDAIQDTVASRGLMIWLTVAPPNMP